MDEPTAALGIEDAALVMDVSGRLADEGAGIAFITHKLKEVMEVSDRVSVLRRGKPVVTAETAATSAKGATNAMVESCRRPGPLGIRPRRPNRWLGSATSRWRKPVDASALTTAASR